MAFQKGISAWNKKVDKLSYSDIKSGHNVGYVSVHSYVKHHKPKPADGLCELCHERSYRDLACITGIYDIDFSSYKYFCHRCHSRFDRDVLDIEQRRCSICGGSTYIRRKDGTYTWFTVDKIQNLYQCKTCHNREKCHKIRLAKQAAILSSSSLSSYQNHQLSLEEVAVLDNNENENNAGGSQTSQQMQRMMLEQIRSYNSTNHYRGANCV